MKKKDAEEFVICYMFEEKKEIKLCIYLYLYSHKTLEVYIKLLNKDNFI